MTIHFEESKRDQKINHLLLQEEEEFVQIMANRLGVTYIDLNMLSISTDALKVIEEKDAIENNIVAFDINDKKLSIAYRYSTAEVDKIIANITSKGYIIKRFLCSKASVNKALSRYKDLSFSLATEAGALDISGKEVEDLINKTKNIKDVEILVEEAVALKSTHKTSKLINTVMAGGLALKASDVHIEAEEEYARIRYRLDGALIELTKVDVYTYRQLISRIKLISGMKLNVKESGQDGRFTTKIYTQNIEIRVSLIPGAYGESVVMRILNPNTINTPLDDLGFPDRLYQVLQEQIARPNGMILNTGPTGSGKTTTLYSCLKKIHTPDVKIITIEDPIEYHLEGIVQTQVGENNNYTFADGLKNAMRQDPDVIMVGEIRDSETANTAIQSSLTGHLVFSTLHTNSAAGTFTRLMDLGIDSKLFTSAIHLALAQRLVRRICPLCSEKVPVPDKYKKVIDITMKSLEGYEELSLIKNTDNVYKTVGCKECNYTGFIGRLGVYEGVLTDKILEEVLRMGPSENEIKEATMHQKIVDMKQDGVIKVLGGVTSFEELERVVDIF